MGAHFVPRRRHGPSLPNPIPSERRFVLSFLMCPHCWDLSCLLCDWTVIWTALGRTSLPIVRILHRLTFDIHPSLDLALILIQRLPNQLGLLSPNMTTRISLPLLLNPNDSNDNLSPNPPSYTSASPEPGHESHRSEQWPKQVPERTRLRSVDWARLVS